MGLAHGQAPLDLPLLLHGDAGPGEAFLSMFLLTSFTVHEWPIFKELE